MEYQYCKPGPEKHTALMRLYRSLIGSPGCTWDEEYPDEEDTLLDLEKGSVLCVLTPEGEIAGAITLEEMDEEVAASAKDERYREYLFPARLGIRKENWGKGMGSFLFLSTLEEAKKRGKKGILFLVAPENTRAKALYTHLGAYEICSCSYCDLDWILMAKDV